MERKYDKVPTVRLKTFATKEKRPQVSVQKVKQVEEENSVIRNMHFVDNLSEEERKHALSYE